MIILKAPFVIPFLAKNLIFMAYDGNAPTVEYLKQTHFPFYEAYRRVKRNVPIVFMSVPCFENFPDAAERQEVLRQSFIRARNQGDENVYFLDGETLFGKNDREICTVEGVHPNDFGFYRIAKAIKVLYDELGF